MWNPPFESVLIKLPQIQTVQREQPPSWQGARQNLGPSFFSESVARNTLSENISKYPSLHMPKWLWEPPVGHVESMCPCSVDEMAPLKTPRYSQAFWNIPVILVLWGGWDRRIESLSTAWATWQLRENLFQDKKNKNKIKSAEDEV